MLTTDKIEEMQITNVMSDSFLDYAMSVIISRALPDVRDGLKPVHRRILYAMSELGMVWNRPTKKSARIVGEVIGKYHPHGDSAVYDTMVRLTQGWKMRVPLIEGQGNFGSIDGDAVAAMRYTEARMKKVTNEFLRGMKDDKKETNVVKFIPNFDGEESEPEVLPGRFPHLLVNGVDGIAVGMATSMPPHNPIEVLDAIHAQMENPDITYEELYEHMKGPDFPTGGIVLGDEGIKRAYETGRGSLVLRGVVEMDVVNGNEALIIRQIPYQVIKEKLITEIKQIQFDYNHSQNEITKNKKKVQKIEQRGMNFLLEVRDETEGENSHADLRIVIELKEGINPDRVMKYLFKKTALQQSYGIINLALVPTKYGDNKVHMEPRELTLKQLISEYIKHQREVTERTLSYELKSKTKELHKVDAVIKALDKYTEVVEIISKSKSKNLAISSLIEFLNIDIEQAEYILLMRLQSLASYQQDGERETHKNILIRIEEIKTSLSDTDKLDEIIKSDLKRMAEEYGVERLTRISHISGEISDEELIEDEDVVITMTGNGLIKRIPQDKYRIQRRNGRGVNGMNTYEDDYVKHLQIANTHDTLMFFTNTGKVYKVKAHQVPMTSDKSKGINIRTVLDIAEGEQVQAILAINDFEAGQFVVFGTKKGMVKRTSLAEYFKSTRNGIGAITLNKDDEVINVSLTSGDKLITIITKKGKSITIEESESKIVSRGGKGVRCINLSKDDVVVSLCVHKGTSELFIATNKGFAKRTPTEEFRVQKRGGKGVTAMRTNDKNGYVVGTAIVEDDKQIILLTKQGIIIKMKVKDISSFSRTAQGSRAINLKEGDELQAVDCNSEEQEDIESIQNLIDVEESQKNDVKPEVSEEHGE